MDQGGWLFRDRGLTGPPGAGPGAPVVPGGGPDAPDARPEEPTFDVEVKVPARDLARAARLEALFSSTADLVLVVDLRGQVGWIGGGLRAGTGYPESAFLGWRPFGLVHPEDRGALVDFLGQHLTAGGARPGVVRLRGQWADGSWHDLAVRAVDRLHDPWIHGLVLTVSDETDLRESVESLRLTARRFQRLAGPVTEAMVVCSADGRVRYATETAVLLLGPAAARPEGVAFEELVAPEDAEPAKAAFAEAVKGTLGSTPIEFRGAHPGREGAPPPHFEATFTNLLDDPAVEGVAVTVHDISERRRATEVLAYQALHDPLTGLPNRSLFMDRLEHSIRRLSREPGSVALLFADVDRFKTINDSLGHGAGDRVLRSLAGRLGTLLRPGDTVARWGGDEFVFLCEGATTDTALAIAERIAEVGGRIPGAGASSTERQPQVTFSVGVAVTEDPDTPAMTLLANADSAMYHAKAAGRSRAAVYDAGLRSAAEGRLETEASLRRALEGDELRLLYQPVVRLSDGAVVGAEALLRWENPRRGLLDPGDFLAVAEESGLIVPIGSWVLATACRQAAEWASVRTSSPLISVNVSGQQLNQPNFVEQVRRDLRESGIQGGQLSLELTENALMADPENAVAVLDDLKSLGVTISLDDFGTGYSSLGQLRRFPIDALKVDRTFVSGLGTDAEDSSVVSAIVGLAKSLGLATVAEGVETSEQAEALSAMGCTLAQGYRFGPPVTAEVLSAAI